MERHDEHDHNRETFDRPDVVEFYEAFDTILPAEDLVFGWAVAEGSRVLDLGVGAGRTTPRLRRQVGSLGRYVGVDYAAGMVAAAAERHPDEPFVQGDATQLPFADASFDVVVFSFNGLDCIHPAPRRRGAIDELHRVLRPGGRAIVSGHNPRAWIVAAKPRRGVAPKVALYRTLVATRDSAVRLARAVRTRPFWSGSGYYPDPEHGANIFHAATPQAFVVPFRDAGFVLAGGPQPADHPRGMSPFRNGWYYYVFDRGI